MDKNIKEIIDAIISFDAPKKIILFGSRARGDEIADSDVDLAVLYDRLDRNPFDIAQALRMNLLGVTTLPIDLLIFESSEFERRSKHDSNIESVIVGEGVLAYG